MEPYLHAANSLLSPNVFVFLALGTVVGMILSSIPGLGPSVTIALLLPMTFGLKPLQALVFLTSLYQASEYGGSITAITAATPGTSNAAALVLDGYEMTRRGSPQKALGYSLWSASASSLIATVALLLIASPVSHVVLAIGTVQLAALELFALTLVASLMQGSTLKGMLSVGLGLLLSTVGTDVLSGAPRFTFGVPQLLNGIPLVPLLLGLFAVSEAVRLLTKDRAVGRSAMSRQRLVWLSFTEWWRTVPVMLFGTVIGFVLGLLPGLAGTVPPWISYSAAKSASRGKETFGEGAVAGIVAPESTNGAVMHATLVPAFFLGIPGTPSSALILGAMTIVGLTPGPLVYAKHQSLILAVFEALIISVVLLWVVGTFVTSVWANVIGKLNQKALGTAILLLAVVGAFASNGQMFGVYVALIAGAVSVVLKATGFSIPALVIAFVIGPGFENNFRTALTYSHGSYLVFVTNPVSAVFLALAVASLVFSAWRARRTTRGRAMSTVTAVTPAEPPVGEARR